jgi:hypothetical protein
MCFIKSSKGAVAVKQDPVIRHEADASVTKNSANNLNSGYKENLRTSAIGLTDEANVNKKTLLGE